MKKYCTNCDAKVYGDDEDDFYYLLDDVYCSECYHELKDELEDPDLGDDGYYNMTGDDSRYSSDFFDD